jgi:hypothetical protein
MAAKKSSQKKSAAKKAAKKKPAPAKKTKTKRERPKKLPLETISVKAVPESVADDFPETGNCTCRQKKPNGKFYCFKLIQGRWIQSSVISFPTKELCEEVCC